MIPHLRTLYMRVTEVFLYVFGDSEFYMSDTREFSSSAEPIQFGRMATTAWLVYMGR